MSRGTWTSVATSRRRDGLFPRRRGGGPGPTSRRVAGISGCSSPVQRCSPPDVRGRRRRGWQPAGPVSHCYHCFLCRGPPLLADWRLWPPSARVAAVVRVAGAGDQAAPLALGALAAASFGRPGGAPIVTAWRRGRHRWQGGASVFTARRCRPVAGAQTASREQCRDAEGRAGGGIGQAAGRCLRRHGVTPRVARRRLPPLDPVTTCLLRKSDWKIHDAFPELWTAF